jgi:hypothetical protein
MTSMALSGLDAVRKTLGALKDKGVKKAAKAGIVAGLQPLLSAIRSEINGAPISAELKAEVRATLGKRLKKEGDDYLGKAGFGVGKANAGKKAKAAARHGTKGGVGISTANVHWFVLGTAERATEKGHRTGKIEPMLAGFVAKAAEQAGSRITSAAADKISKVLAAEALKKGS